MHTAPANVVSSNVRAFVSPTLGEGLGQQFELGDLVVTPAARAVLAATGTAVGALLARHVCGDWSDMPGFAASQASMAADEGGLGVHASYLCRGMRVVVLTKADRSETTVMTPAEYGFDWYGY